MNQSALLIGRAEWVGHGVVEFSKGLTSGEGLKQAIKISDGVTDQAVSFGTVSTAKVLIVASDKQISLKLNGGSESLSLSANGVMVLFNVSITGLSISNSSGATATVDVLILGD